MNMWYKIGQVAMRLVKIPLARHAFEEGLHCNPDHWPCLDNLITVLYTLSDYSCEFYSCVCVFVCVGAQFTGKTVELLVPPTGDNGSGSKSIHLAVGGLPVRSHPGRVRVPEQDT